MQSDDNFVYSCYCFDKKKYNVGMIGNPVLVSKNSEIVLSKVAEHSRYFQMPIRTKPYLQKFPPKQLSSKNYHEVWWVGEILGIQGQDILSQNGNRVCWPFRR